jgi:hypothetical protein
MLVSKHFDHTKIYISINSEFYFYVFGIPTESNHYLKTLRFEKEDCTRSISLRAHRILKPKKWLSKLSKEDKLLKYEEV